MCKRNPLLQRLFFFFCFLEVACLSGVILVSRHTSLALANGATCSPVQVPFVAKSDTLVKVSSSRRFSLHYRAPYQGLASPLSSLDIICRTRCLDIICRTRFVKKSFLSLHGPITIISNSTVSNSFLWNEVFSMNSPLLWLSTHPPRN